MSVHERRATLDAALESRLHDLGPALDGEPDPAFRAATRARLVAMAAVRTPAPPPVSGWRRVLALRADTAAPRRRPRLAVGLAGAALAITVLATLVAVSTGARPGDVLYGLKRGTEQTQLALAGDSRGRTLLQFAGTRLAELDGLRADGDSSLAVGTLRTMNQETTEAASLLTTRAVATRSSAPVEALASWTNGQRAGLVALQPRLPAGARPAAAHSLDLLARVGVRASAMTTALACPTEPATTGRDALGPVPAPCAAPSFGPPAGTGGSGAPRASLPPPVPATGSAGAPAGTGGRAGGGASGAPSGSPGTAAAPSPGPVGGSAGAGVPSTPPLVDVPPPSLPLPLPTPALPSLPLPGSAPTASTGSPGAPPSGPVSGICLPPLVTLGDC